MTSQLIRRFQIKGVTTDAGLEMHKQTWHKTIVTMMKDAGFAPVYDLDPVIHLSYVEEDKYEFSYTWHGVYVGEDEAWTVEGVSNGKRIPSTPKSK